MTCPFCGESGFDKPGLASHLKRGQCDPCEDAYSEIEKYEQDQREAYLLRRAKLEKQS